MVDFVTGLLIALREMFKTKKTINYPFEKGKMSIGDNHPPRNNIEPNEHINNIFAYSPNQNIAYIIPEYSV